MRISCRYRFAFLCMPKCASTSIESALDPYAELYTQHSPRLKHTNFRIYSQYIGPYLKSTFETVALETICLVREPVSWYHSWYRFRSRRALRDPSHPNYRRSTAGISFNEFIESVMMSDPPEFAKLASQYDFICDDNGKVGVDRLFRFDRLDQFEKYISQKIGKPISIPKKLASPEIPMEFDENLKLIFKDYAAKDLCLYESIK